MCDECDYSEDEIAGDDWHEPRFDLVERALGSEVAPPDVRPAWRRKLARAGLRREIPTPLWYHLIVIGWAILAIVRGFL